MNANMIWNWLETWTSDGSFTLSLVWLAGLSLVAIGYGLKLMWQSDYGFSESVLYLPAYLLGRLLWRVQFTNPPPPELRSGAILAPNHRSSVDPMFIQLAAKRRVHWMVAKEYCQIPVMSALMKALQVIPTNRSGTDINSTKIAMRYAQQGRLVGMFPEGRINVTAAPLLPVRAGAAMVALKAGVPIIPLYLHGSPFRESVLSPLLMPARVQITFGQAVHPVEPQLETNEPAQQFDESGDSPRANNQRQATWMMQRWGQSMLRLAGRPHATFELGSSRAKVRRDSKQSANDQA
ncbi:MAG: 1-acyl-sn-glycerol-3-phosphate acyltransferase [Pirellulaceae bacterium]|nr:1-acyl-sn-glycerol-3-phosphate acyltransferase [Pirellulaceae bacterium]